MSVMRFDEGIGNTLLNRKKFVILCFGVILMFFTSMSKMLVPGPIYNFLLNDLNLIPSQIAGIGAIFMYSYAVSQLLIGIYSNRYGGVRILLIGGSLFTMGMIGFPLCSNILLLKLFRCLTGFGAGVVFIANTKLLADLFPIRFAMILGGILFIGYLGPVTGTIPLVWLIARCGWRMALFLPGFISLLLMTGIVLLARGTIKKTVPGQTFSLVYAVLKVRPMWFLCISASIIFGIYYVLLTQIGQKCFQDFYLWEQYRASACITILTLIVALNNILVNFLLRLTGGKTKPVLLFAMICALLGSGLGYVSFRMHLPSYALVIAFILTAIPAGFFSFYSLIAKELNIPENTGLSVALLNFSAFVFIALFGDISGVILDRWKEEMQDNMFPGSAYTELFLFMAVSALTALILAFFIPNIDGNKKDGQKSA